MKIIIFTTYYLSIGLGLMIVALITSIVDFKSKNKSEDEAYNIIKQSKLTYLLILPLWPIFVILIIWALITEGCKVLFSALGHVFEKLIRSIFKDL